MNETPPTEEHHEDALVAEILGDARKKAERTLRRAEHTAAQLLEKAQADAEETRRSLLEAAQRRAEREKKIVLATVDLEARRMRMEAQERAIAEVFDTAEKRLFDREAYPYPDVLRRLVVQAAEAIGGDSFVLELAAADGAVLDFEALRAELAKKLGTAVEVTRAPEPAPIRAGVVACSGDGHRLVDNSLGGRLARLHDELRRQTAQILFGGAEPCSNRENS